MLQVTTNGRQRQARATKAELAEQLAEMTHKADVLEDALKLEARTARQAQDEGLQNEEELARQLEQAYADKAGLAEELAKESLAQLQLRDKLAAATARAEAAEAARLARPQTATPPANGHAKEGLLATQRGVLRLWIMTDEEGYRLRLIHMGTDGCGWELTKWSDGTQYHLHQADGADITCDCPGGTAHGPRCCDGKGCKHARMLRAVRQVVDQGL